MNILDDSGEIFFQLFCIHVELEWKQIDSKLSRDATKRLTMKLINIINIMENIPFQM